jgi:ABC-type lipoprotein release transport system permease subunit
MTRHSVLLTLPSLPFLFVTTTPCLLVVALSTCYLPVLRAARVDPVETLKTE